MNYLDEIITDLERIAERMRILRTGSLRDYFEKINQEKKDRDFDLRRKYDQEKNPN